MLNWSQSLSLQSDEVHFIPVKALFLFVHYGSLMFENALYCAVAVCDNYTLCDFCKYAKYCVFSVYDFVYTCVNTFISPVQSVFKKSYLSKCAGDVA